MTSPDDTTAPAALPRRPEVCTLRIEDLIRGVLAGQIRVPAFHRGLKWEPKDALELLDSIARGYPIGTLLLWRRPAPDERLVHGSVVIDAPAQHDALWVIDGQQRISSLLRIFAGKGHPDEPLSAFYNPETRTFRHLQKREVPAEFDLPLNEVFDYRRLYRWLATHYSNASVRHVEEFVNGLRGFGVAAYIIDTPDELTVREIFRRTNLTGKRLEISEVFDAIYSREGLALASLQDVANSLAQLAFGPLGQGTLLNMLLATRGTELGKERVLELQPAEARRAMLDLERCARAGITFLRHDVGIPHISLLPYSQSLLILARFFHLYPEPHPRSRELLARWFWRHAVTEPHSGGPLQTRQLLAVLGGDEHGSLQRLLRIAPQRSSAKSFNDKYSFSSARSKVHILALLDLQPRNLQTAEVVALGADDFGDGEAYRHLIRTIVRRTVDGAGCLADRIVHPQISVDMASAIVDCEASGLLSTHAISGDAQCALKDQRPDEFLRIRRIALEEQVRNFIEARAEWDEPDTPPLEALHVQGG